MDLSYTRRKLMMGLAAATSALVARKTFACTTCHDFNGSDYRQSVASCDMPLSCANGIKRVPYLTSLHPGLFTRQEPAGLVVADILSGSPAAGSGIEIGTRNSSSPGRLTRFSMSDQ